MSTRLGPPGTSPPRASSREARAVRRQAGFTLIETLIAIVVFAVGVLALVSLMPIGTKKISNSAMLTRGSELAATVAEKLLVTPYFDPDLDAGNHNDPDNPHDGRFFVSWSVEEDQPIAACKRVTVVVRWPVAGSPLSTRLVVVTPRAGG